jgi:hypothetical protein
MGKINFFLSTLPFCPWAVLATWLSSSENIGKFNLMPILNKLHIWSRNWTCLEKIEKKTFFFTQTAQFLVSTQGILGVKIRHHIRKNILIISRTQQLGN